MHGKKIVCYDAQSQGTAAGTDNGRRVGGGGGGGGGMEVDGSGEEGGGDEEDEEEDEEEGYYHGRSLFSSKDGGGGGWWRYFSFRTSSSCLWICLQLSWRLMVSLGVALLVFCIATKPPPPNIYIKVPTSSSL